MRSFFILLILASPATAWEFSPAPICTLTDTSDAGTLTVTYDATTVGFTLDGSNPAMADFRSCPDANLA